MSAIPMTPFEEMHSKADIPLGTPHPKELDGTGYMPFKWFDANGSVVFVHPINFEYYRARGIYELYKEILDFAAEKANSSNGVALNDDEINDLLKGLMEGSFVGWRILNTPSEI
jgi:hypothetical protein